jgi:hypothetical protein
MVLGKKKGFVQNHFFSFEGEWFCTKPFFLAQNHFFFSRTIFRGLCLVPESRTFYSGRRVLENSFFFQNITVLEAQETAVRHSFKRPLVITPTQRSLYSYESFSVKENIFT